MKVSSVSEMRALDRTAIREFGIAAELLMENAGQAVYFTLLKEFGVKGKRFVIFCGLGNNGGDGFVVARKIYSSGGAVEVFILGDPSRFEGVDIPSGVHGDTGKVMGAAVRADVTIAFGLPKIGNMLLPGYDLGGKLYVSHISFPPSMYNADALKIEISPPVRLPPRDQDGHKGDFGQALFIAGAAGYFGAPYFSALLFLKAGGGYSRLAAPRSIVPFIGNKGSEIVFHPQAETDAGSIALQNKPALLELSERIDMVIVGPGLSLDPETQRLTRELTAEIDKPLLVDGDGITALCQDLEIVQERQAETILTSHLGEMSRITGTSVREIDGDKIGILQRTGHRAERHDRPQGRPLTDRVSRRARVHQHERESRHGHGGVGRRVDGDHRRHVRPGTATADRHQAGRVCSRACRRPGGRGQRRGRHHRPGYSGLSAVSDEDDPARPE